MKRNHMGRRLLAPFLFLCLVLQTAAAFAAAPLITADAAIVVDRATGAVLYEKNADKREYPASMTKMMTCLLAIESGRMDSIVQVSPEAADVECTRMEPGDQVVMRDLTKQMMLISDNGAATAVGESLGQGDIDYFAERMNRRAQSLGMASTHFVNANGMPDSDHYTTARDMSKLATAAFENDTFRSIVGTKEAYVYYVRPTGRVEHCVNTDELLWSYRGIIGGKTGWTNAARGCLTVAADRDGRELVAVVMHSNDDETRFQEAAKLLDYGFSRM
ncbi:D-alanyl-D-alanine carboxypeptidase family protein [uncultured Selenomonas sp.]|uniref:D-alanyl-D-alanine carboxypeptidase family protein n=1 Tax=uncultured Selenomonas sp. TaxID=159275 RepID=UPI0025E4B92E|nr:D-alanyl-D-alanine carboxypeptidase family protein [uncultured Selenomonas sp.]